MGRGVPDPAANGGPVGVLAVATICEPSAAERIAHALRAGGIDPVATAATPDEAEQPGPSPLDALVVDGACLGGRVQSIRALRERLAPGQVVLVSDSASARSVAAALAAGADAVLLESELRELPHVIRLVASGHAVVPAQGRESLLKPALSMREKQVLAMVVMGFTNGEIARKLYVTESTVKSHLSSAFRKLGVRSRNEAARLILDPENGLGAGILALSDGDAEPLPLLASGS